MITSFLSLSVENVVGYMPNFVSVCSTNTKYFVINKCYQMPKWEESIEGARERYKNIIKILADKYPTENLLLVTHGKRLFFLIFLKFNFFNVVSFSTLTIYNLSFGV